MSVSSNRRTTLGPLTLNNLQSNPMNQSSIMGSSGKPPRMSMGPTMGGSSLGASVRRASMGPIPGGSGAAPTSRKSLLPAAAPRNSSISTTSSCRLTDPRNIGDKQFISNSIRTLIDFCSLHGFDYALTPKILSKPTNKDFNNIVLFLFRLIDPNFKCSGKFEDEMITMFKYLGYPFQIAKSNISAVGSPHAWPTLLATIMWLVELLSYDTAASFSNMNINNTDKDASEVDLDDPSSSEKAFYRYLGKAYELFLSGKDDQYARLEEQFISSFENKNVLIRDQIEAFEKRNQALTHEIEEVKNRSAYLPELEAKKREFQSDLSRFQQLMEELRKHRDQLKTKTENRSAELERLKTTNSNMQKEVLSLKDRISNQELSPADVSNMINERQRLEEAQQAASELRQSLQRRIWELEMALRDKVQGLEDTVKAYHSTAEDLKLVPQTARNARGEDLSIQIDIGAKKREGLLRTDIRRAVLPVLQDIRQELSDTTLGLRSELLAEQDMSEELSLKQHELQEAREALDSKLRRAEAAYKREKELLDQAADLHSVELDAMESRLLQLRDTSSEETSITAATRRVSEIASLRTARRAEHQRKKAAMQEAVTDLVGQCAAHREMLQTGLQGIKTSYANKLETFLQMPEDNTNHKNNNKGHRDYSLISSQLLSSSSPADIRAHLRASPSPHLISMPTPMNHHQHQQQQQQQYPQSQPMSSNRDRHADIDKENIFISFNKNILMNNNNNNNNINMNKVTMKQSPHSYPQVDDDLDVSVAASLNDSYDRDIVSVAASSLATDADPRRAIDFRMYHNNNNNNNYNTGDCDQSSLSQYV